jgi:hypothetical protein
LGVVRWREVARGRKTVEDQGVPWMKTRVCCELDGELVAVGEERRAYLISQLLWWKVDGREIGSGVVSGFDIVLEDSFSTWRTCCRYFQFRWEYRT